METREAIAIIKDRINLVDLIGRNVKLRKSSGSEWVGLCPFHSERSPSFYVIPEKGFYTCFGCHESGDAFDWLQKHEGQTFTEALEELAGMAGVELPKRGGRVDTGQDQRMERMRAIITEAQAFFEAQLVSEDDAMCYLQGRGLKSEFIHKAGLGMAPPTWDMLVRHLRSQGYKDAEIESTGVATQGQRGGLIDFLRSRITIPIHDYRGKLIAFGGRVLGDEKPKYLNTRETDLFHKGETLFGLHEAKAHLGDGALAVEGYFDVLTLHMLGIGCAVAPLGTALTEAHLDRLAKYTKRLTLCFDGDEAGHRAMEKTLAIALPKGFDVRLLELPKGEDPDTWAASVGEEAFRNLIRRAPDWTGFKVQRAIMDKDMRRTPDRMAVLEELAPMLRYVPVANRDTFFATLAHQLQLPTSEVARAAGAGPAEPSDEPEAPKPAPSAPKAHDAIKALVMAWIDPATKQAVVDTPRTWFQHLQGAEVLEEILDGAEGHEVFLRECDALRIVGGAPRVDRLLLSLETSFIDSQLRQLRAGMEDPKTPPDAIPGYEKAQVELLLRRSRLNRRK